MYFRFAFVLQNASVGIDTYLASAMGWWSMIGSDTINRRGSLNELVI